MLGPFISLSEPRLEQVPAFGATNPESRGPPSNLKRGKHEEPGGFHVASRLQPKKDLITRHLASICPFPNRVSRPPSEKVRAQVGLRSQQYKLTPVSNSCYQRIRMHGRESYGGY